MSAAGEYRSFRVRIKDGPDYRALTPSAKLVWVHLRWNLGRTGIGVLNGAVSWLAEETGLDEPEVSRALAQLEAFRYAGHPWLVRERNVFWLVHALRDEPSCNLGNKNHRGEVGEYLSALPPLAVVAKFRAHYELDADPDLPAPLPHGMGDGMGDGIPHGMGEQGKGKGDGRGKTETEYSSPDGEARPAGGGEPAPTPSRPARRPRAARPPAEGGATEGGEGGGWPARMTEAWRELGYMAPARFGAALKPVVHVGADPPPPGRYPVAVVERALRGYVHDAKHGERAQFASPADFAKQVGRWVDDTTPLGQRADAYALGVLQ